MKIKLLTIFMLLCVSISNLKAQDYLISFAGSGLSTTVTTVKVENLTQGTTLTMSGSDVLHLMGFITGTETVSENETVKIKFYPNPMNDYARMKFVLPESGETMITLHDISGRKIVQKEDLLSKGLHSYVIQGIEKGMYVINISSGRYSFHGRLLCSESQNKDVKIEYESTLALQEKPSDSKGINTEILMQYTTGDRLKLTGTSGIYSTVITDIPTSSKTVTYTFINCTDGDNNNYPVVKIGTQVWMAENLKTTTYRNGVSIGTTIPHNKDVYRESAPKYQWAYNGNESSVATYGRLYTWYAVMDSRNVCPSGWHVPNLNESITLIMYLGGYSRAGGKLKETGITHWDENYGATNETGFTALPGGSRDAINSKFWGIERFGYWWNSTEVTTEGAISPILFWHGPNIDKYIQSKKEGDSVRCIKD